VLIQLLYFDSVSKTQTANRIESIDLRKNYPKKSKKNWFGSIFGLFERFFIFILDWFEFE